MSGAWSARRDAAFWVALALYAANGWLLKPVVGGAFFHGSFNDLLLIPAALPLVLEVQSQLGWRERGRPPQIQETVFHLVVWGVFCEWLGPWWLGRGTSDVMDVACYAAGAVPAQWWWSRWESDRVEETSKAARA
jgi:hypothetical protein